MYCTNCGAELQAGSKFCQSCGTAVAEKNPPQHISDENPYAVTAPPAPLPIPQPEPQPQYFRPVNTPQGTQYVPVTPVLKRQAEAPKFNVFTFISAGIAATMFFVALFPWFTLNEYEYSIADMIEKIDLLERYGLEGFAVTGVLMFIALALLVPQIILALVKRNRMPLGFAIAASAIVSIAVLVAVAVTPSFSYILETTYVGAIMFVFSVANVVFAVFARKK